MHEAIANGLKELKRRFNFSKVERGLLKNLHMGHVGLVKFCVQLECDELRFLMGWIPGCG